MPNALITPNMNLPNPVPGVDPGPDYAENIQSCMNQIDQHNHSAGQGIQIQPNGLNISSDLPFNGNNATLLNSVRLVSLATPLTNVAPDIGCLYVSGNELYFNDYSGGNQVQITLNGTVNATSSGIASGTATAAFVAGTLVVKSSSTSFANIDMQSAVLSNNGNLTNQLTLQAPILSSSYDITLPTIPVVTNLMTLDTSGNMAAVTNVDNLTIEIVSNNLQLKNQGITQAKLAPRATGSTVPAGGVGTAAQSVTYSISGSSESDVPGMVVVITTTGRPVHVGIMATSGNNSLVEATRTSNTPRVRVGFSRDNSTFFGYGEISVFTNAVAQVIQVPGSSFSAIDFVAAGTYTYRVRLNAASGTDATIAGCTLVVYEL